MHSLKNKATLSTERLKLALNYDPDTGIFTRVNPISKKARVGHVNKYNNLYINVDSRLYPARKLIVLYMDGVYPEGEVIHMDGDKTNHRYANLRQVSIAEYRAHRGVAATNTSGYTGCTWAPSKQAWLAYLKIDGKQMTLGYHQTSATAYLYRQAGMLTYAVAGLLIDDMALRDNLLEELRTQKDILKDSVKGLTTSRRDSVKNTLVRIRRLQAGLRAFTGIDPKLLEEIPDNQIQPTKKSATNSDNKLLLLMHRPKQ